MIYGRMGGELVLVREATVEEVLKDWGVKPTAKSAAAQKEIETAKSRVGYGMMWWARWPEDGQERLCELAFCRADGGWAEIDDARKAIMGEARHAEASGRRVRPAEPAPRRAAPVPAFREEELGGVLDASGTVHSDADPGL